MARVKTHPQRNAFGTKITIGRAKNNDLVIPQRLVSKFHAYLRSVDGVWTIHDANSRHGTWVDGEKVEADGRPVQSGSRIDLAGRVELTFLTAADLYPQLR